MSKKGESDISISIIDTSKHADKFGGHYISYKIVSTTERSGFIRGECFVIRRYNDFTWLATELSKEFPGVIMPPLPEKQTVGRFTSEFIESRKRGLEKFLQRLGAHSEIGYSQTLIAFLQGDDATLTKAKNEKNSKPKKSTMAWIEGTMNSLTTKVEIEKSAADIKTEEISQYVLSLEKQMLNVTKHSENLIKRAREHSHFMVEFAQSFSWLGQSEGDAIGTALQEFGSTVNQLSGFGASHAEDLSLQFLEPLEEYQRILLSIKTAMLQRLEKKNAYMNAKADQEAKQTARNKLAGVPGKEAQFKAKDDAVTAAVDATEEAKLAFEQVSARLLFEFDSFKNQKAADIKQIILNFVNLQIEFNKKTENTWVELLPKIQSVIVSETSDFHGFIESTSKLNTDISSSSSSSPSPLQHNPFGDYDYDNYKSSQVNHPNHISSGTSATGSNFEEHYDEDEDGDTAGV